MWDVCASLLGPSNKLDVYYRVVGNSMFDLVHIHVLVGMTATLEADITEYKIEIVLLCFPKN